MLSFRTNTQQLPLRTGTYIGLGSNLGDRAGYLLLAVRELLEAGLHVVRLSSIYQTAPLEVLDQPHFLNMVAEISYVDYSPTQVLAHLLRIENALGRRRSIKSGPRTIDLDLLVCANETSVTESLQLPHPRLHLRNFVLVPLAELEPTLLIPGLGRTAAELLRDSPDTSEVMRWEPNT